MPRVIVCPGCRKERIHRSKGLCVTCYQREYLKLKMKDDPEFRERRRKLNSEYQMRRYHNDPEFRRKVWDRFERWATEHIVDGFIERSQTRAIANGDDQSLFLDSVAIRKMIEEPAEL